MLNIAMVDKISSWKFAEDFHQEPEVIAKARTRADELGIESITPALGSHLALLVNATSARAIVEVGTGAGVSGLWLLSGNDQAVLVSIDAESEYQNIAKLAFNQADIPANRLRLINGKAVDVLKNLADGSYDLVFLDGDRESLIQQLTESLRVLRLGGVLVIAHALWRDRVPDDFMQDEATEDYRALLEKIKTMPDLITVLSPTADGLLLITKAS
ncbi:MAG: hypothetical protein RIQ88_24 [Actinomycetota bacterium]|jgi:predicted O-methyltransferase YrrM